MTKKISYSSALKELEKILDQIENDDLDVDDLTDSLKKASTLLKFCKEKLYKADTEIQKILDDIQ